MTTNQKAEEYSSRICKKSGKYTKGEIETAYATGYNDAEREAIKAFDMFLRFNLDLNASEERYSSLMSLFTDVMKDELHS